MPCFVDDRPDPDAIRREAQAEFRHNSDVAEMLCALCRRMEEQRTLTKYAHHEILEWWKAHKRRDEEKAKLEGKRRHDERRRTEEAIKRHETEIARLRQQL